MKDISVERSATSRFAATHQVLAGGALTRSVPDLRTERPATSPRASTTSHSSLILVTSYPGQPSCTELERQAAAGERPRKDYVELARLLGGDVVDERYMTERATPLARVIARRASVSGSRWPFFTKSPTSIATSSSSPRGCQTHQRRSCSASFAYTLIFG